MRNKPSLWANWLKYLIARDKISKIVILLAVAFTAFAFTLGQGSVDPLIAIGALAGSFAFSFLSYVCVGLPRVLLERKLYDAIASDCKFPWRHEGRTMNRVKVKWSLLAAKKVTVDAEIASSATTSASTWRTLRSAASDAFTGGKKTYITIFDEHERGTLIFVLPGSLKDPVLEDRYRKIEELTSFVYDGIHKYGNSLPRIKNLVGFEDGSDFPESFIISVPFLVEKYSRQNFERDFKQKYENSNVLWMFKWSGLGVEISCIERGSPEERKLYVVNSVADLIKSSYRTSFHYSDKDYVFNEEMISWDSEGKPERLTIDFLHSDISRVDHQERFQELTIQGLHQILKTPYWDFKWSVSLYEKILTIQRLESFSESEQRKLPEAEVNRNVPAAEEAPVPVQALVAPVEAVSSPVPTQTPSPVARTAQATPRLSGLPTPPSRPMPVRPSIRKS